jgi:hypothetical protein
VNRARRELTDGDGKLMANSTVKLSNNSKVLDFYSELFLQTSNVQTAYCKRMAKKLFQRIRTQTIAVEHCT